MFHIINSEQFVQFDEDATKTNERKVQRMLHKIKPNLTDQNIKDYVQVDQYQVNFRVQQSFIKSR